MSDRAGFAVGFDPQDVIEENAREKVDDPEWFKHASKEGVVTEAGDITDHGWEILNKDIGRIEQNALRWLRQKFEGVRDEGHGGHGGDELIGTFWFDPLNPDQAHLIELAADTGRQERIDMTDASYGDFANTAFDGVSDFGASVLGGSITFFNVEPEDMEVIEQTLEVERRRSPSARESRRPHRQVRAPWQPGFRVPGVREGRAIRRSRRTREDRRQFSLTYGTLPPFDAFIQDIRRPDPDYDDGRSYWPEGTLFPMELVSNEEIALAEQFGNLAQFASRYSHKAGFRGDEQTIYNFLSFLAEEWNNGNEEAGDLASSILTVLGYEWV